MTSFVYPPLRKDADSIRILKLAPGDFSDPLVGTLTPVTFREKPRYIALSYTWGGSYPDNSTLSISYGGSADDPIILKIDNESLQVSHNLCLALLHLRSPAHAVNLWVDAVCINQANMDERNQQVSLMSFIYNRAIKVISWIGIRQYSKPNGVFRSMSLEWKVGQTRHLAATLIGKSHVRSSPRPTQATILRIAESAYWSRLWIVPEVCLPRLLVLAYGSEVWTFDEFRQWMRAEARPLSPSFPDVYAPMRQLFEVREKRHTDMMRLETLIETFASNNCSELRDRVFGLLGCANDIQPYWETDRSKGNPKNSRKDDTTSKAVATLNINYAASFYEIWFKVVKLIYLQAKSIKGRIDEKLGNADEHHTSSNQSSSVMVHERALSIVRTAGIIQFALGQKVEEEIVNGKVNVTLFPSNFITALGYIAGEIIQLGPDYSSLMSSSRAQRNWMGCWPEHYVMADDIEVIRRIGEEYMTKLVECDQGDVDRVRNIRDPGVIAWPATQGEDIPRVPDSTFNATADKVTSAHPSSEDIEPRVCLGTGYLMGLVASAARIGDIIVRFWNCDAAVVMRPTQIPLMDNQNSIVFSLIGRANVADIYDRTATAGRDLRAEHCMSSTPARGFIEGSSHHYGPLHVRLNLKTLQMVTAYTNS
ncbi:heterokaryon incompatibility protein-domain-containing protein [Xylariaceae sp. FL1019]|nr:heterokaryon incompatibility protein-domain-containing protein [Xylariaceae sp. FL1019]